MIVEKKFKRRRRKAALNPDGTQKPKPKLYFHSGTQDAIVMYQQSTDPKERERLYVTDIEPAFSKLVENLINIHKFTSLHDSFDDLKNDVVTFLFETIRKFDSTRGTNAFSYFNICAKNCLIIKTKQKQQRTRRSVSIDDPDTMSSNELRVLEDHNTIQSQETILENATSAINIVELLHEIRGTIKSENELSCINSIITIFENMDQVDLVNKSAVLLYLRELSGLSPKQLTTTMQTIKRHYRRLKIDPKFRFF